MKIETFDQWYDRVHPVDVMTNPATRHALRETAREGWDAAGRHSVLPVKIELLEMENEALQKSIDEEHCGCMSAGSHYMRLPSDFIERWKESENGILENEAPPPYLESRDG